MYSKNVKFDKFYTRSDIAYTCVSLLELDRYKTIIEPSAGNGAFINHLPINKTIALDI